MFGKYVFALIIGWIISTGLSILLTVIRFGIPMCNNMLKEETDENIILGLYELKKRYMVSVIVWLTIILLSTVGCFFWLESAVLGYFIAILLNIGPIIRTSGNNENNLLEFKNSLESNISYIINKR